MDDMPLLRALTTLVHHTFPLEALPSDDDDDDWNRNRDRIHHLLSCLGALILRHERTKVVATAAELKWTAVTESEPDSSAFESSGSDRWVL